MKPIIKVEGLSKQYRIGAREKPHQTIREALALAFASPFKGRSANGGSSNTIWALEDVEFDVYPGEIVGIIGRNGAGKSTLLKVLSGVTEPTNGRAAIYGRVGSLLEVGTGFHPELTGRENVFLNGAILGMKKVEIKRKFDEIVAFSEIEKFLDTPVKHYSSGMYMRLAFAVAAHLEPEVLLVDEVLAVGDADFQKKCLTKIRDVAQKGRTVLFVTHNLSSITMLCTRALFFSSGHIIDDGPPMKVVDNYMSKVRTGKPYVEWENPAKAPGTDRMRLKSVRILNEAGQVTGSFGMDDPIFVEITYWLQQSGLETNAGYHLYNSTGVLAFISQDLHDKEWLNVQKDSGCYRSVGRIPGQFLNEGTYFLDAVLFKSPGPRTDVYERELLVFEVVDRGHSEVRGRFTGNWSVGVLRPNLPWKTTAIAEK